jgi:subtilisin family serine protease
MVPGELIVRLKSDFPECAHCLLGKGAGLRGATGTYILDQVRLRHGITAMEPVFGGVHAAERRQAAQRRFGRGADSGGVGSLDSELSTVDLSQIYLVRVHPKTDLLKLAGDFRRDPNVISAEPNYLYSTKSTVHSRELRGGSGGGEHADAGAEFPSPASLAGEGEGEGSAFLPNDPFLHSSGSWGQDFPDLWGLLQIQVPAAWELTQGEGVIVAVVDTGLDIEHPDIAANVWRNGGEIAGNGIDDDGNGFVDDVYGWDFTRCKVFFNFQPGCAVPKEPGADVSDPLGHGTHVAGTIAAVGDNGIGVIGVAPRAQVMALKGLNAQGTGANADLAEALVYAAENGARVINASWSGPPSETIRMAVEYVAGTFDAVVVASAGNGGVPLERGVFPANLPEALAVGATTHRDQRATFSNFGGPLDLTAPGGGGKRAAGGGAAGSERAVVAGQGVGVRAGV